MSEDRRVWAYRTLVSHASVPFWKAQSISRVACRPHLYTLIRGGVESDEFEEWLGREIESPAEEAIAKATSGDRLAKGDWLRLIRYCAAQDLRTPARLLEDLNFWGRNLPRLMASSMARAVKDLETAEEWSETFPFSNQFRGDLPAQPFCMRTELVPGHEFGILRAEVTAGRALWLQGIQRNLTETVEALFRHRWSILAPPDGLTWLSSDNPVVRLNFHNEKDYNLQGGWASQGSEILFPLDPFHLLYAQVGERARPRGERMPLPLARLVRRFTAENAHRMIFSKDPDAEVLELRPRTVDAGLFHAEEEEWNEWHKNQTEAEVGGKG